MFQLRHGLRAAFTMACLAAPAFLQAQVTWGGGFPNDNFSVTDNWVGGVAPLDDGSETLAFTDNGDGTLNLDIAADFLGIQVGTACNTAFQDIGGPSSLTIGDGGITVAGDSSNYGSLKIKGNVNVILAALENSQTWSIAGSGGSLMVHGMITETGGPQSLTFTSPDGYDGEFGLYSGGSTFSGGLTVAGNGTVLIVGASSVGPANNPTSGPVGRGVLTLGDGTDLTTATSSPVTIANLINVGDNTNGNGVTFGGGTGSNSDLTLSGIVAIQNEDTEIDVGSGARVTFAGGINGSGLCLDFGGGGSSTGSLAIVSGPTSASRLDLEDSASVIFDGGPGQLTLGDWIGTTVSTYVGIGSSNAGSVSSFISSNLSPAYFSGTLGLDTVSGATATFADAIDLSGFTGTDFIGLGSATSAILTGTITPPGGLGQQYGTTYGFGGGGGKLFVQSSIVDSSWYDGEEFNNESNNLQLSAGNAPLTLILQGSLSYSGNTSSTGGALIFDTALSSNISMGSFQIGNSCTPGYIGYTEAAGLTPSQFLCYINAETVNGVVGFDSHDPSNPVVITNGIDLTSDGFSGNTYLGTATIATLDGPITPANDGPYQFAGVKGGKLTVETSLADVDGSTGVAIGLPKPIESFGSTSSVTLSGVNTYSGNTTLNSGTLNVTNSASLGTGTLIVPDNSNISGAVGTLTAVGGPVTIGNAIQIPQQGLALNTGSTNILTLTGLISDYGSDFGFLDIFGPVDIEGANTFRGGTFINVSPSTVVTVGTNTGLGSGFLGVVGGIINFNGSAESFTSASFSGSTVNFAGTPIIGSLQMTGSTINFADNTFPEIDSMSSDGPGSTNVINLGSSTGASLYLNFSSDPSFYGTINGAGSIEVGGGSLDLRGANTYAGGTLIDSQAMVIASSNSALGTGPVTVDSNATLVTNIGVTVHNGLTLNDGAFLAGFGTYAPGGNLTIQNGTAIVAGSLPLTNGSNTSTVPALGTLTFGNVSFPTSLTFAPGGIMAFIVTDANGGPGAGYSTVNVVGSLTFTASVGNPFELYLFTAAPGTNTPYATAAANFDPTQAYHWTLLTATGGITNFNANDFQINLSTSDGTSFLNSTGVGQFYVTSTGNTLELNFSPVPEPSTVMLMASGLCAVGAAFRRRRRS